jgi:hypothetical protein
MNLVEVARRLQEAGLTDPEIATIVLAIAAGHEYQHSSAAVAADMFALTGDVLVNAPGVRLRWACACV